MKIVHFLFFILLFTTRAIAQQNHFIYIQTDNKQAFYIKLADKVLSSSSTGYLVISKLLDGTYNLEIGFPKNEWPVQRITVTVKNKDAGYVWKNFESKGWGLYNMQTMEVLMATGNAASADPVKQPSGDGFADVLSDVVSTPLNKQTPVVKEELKPQEPEKKEIVMEVKQDKPLAEMIRPAIKLSSASDATGISAVYVDSFENKSDTVMIFIPATAVVVEAVKEKKETPVEVVKQDEKKEEPKTAIRPVDKTDTKFLDMELPNPNSKDSVVKTEVKTNAVIITNMECKMTATEDDFLKLRKKMAAEKSDDEMVAVARKAFKSKCYSTEQVNNLSVLFLKDDGKYNFFDAAYPRVSDSQNFPSLISKLSDEYYITRFKAMIRH